MVQAQQVKRSHCVMLLGRRWARRQLARRYVSFTLSSVLI
jgi:hypothetical protein